MAKETDLLIIKLNKFIKNYIELAKFTSKICRHAARLEKENARLKEKIKNG